MSRPAYLDNTRAGAFPSVSAREPLVCRHNPESLST